MLTSKFLLYQLIMRYYLICAFALVLLYPLGIDLYLVGLPEIARTLNADEAQLHSAFSCYLAGMALAMLLGGHLADRLGRKPVALCGALIFVLSSIWAATTLSITAFLFARAGQGIGAGAAYLVTFAILRDVLDDQRRAKVLSMINGITCIVPVLAPVLGHLVLQSFPWPALFVLMALLAAAALFLCLGLQESLPAKTAGELIADESLLCVTFVSRLLISCLAVTAILTFVNTSPMLLMEQLGLDSGGYASAMGGLALVSMVMAFVSPWLIDSIGQQRMLQLSQLAFALAATVLLLAASLAAELWLYLLGIGFVCAGFSVGFGVTMSQALAPFAERSALASSILGICQISWSGAFIAISAWFGLTASTMLILSLLIAALGSIILLCFTSRAPIKTNSQWKQDEQSLTSPRS
ncbi:MdtL family multidrug efflux MFS transporter [Shewanella algae]|uniref:MdtL family multidrug efflux MFS transporter n=1 Tax=Shewanella algae TaxID=38313 RepID=UPI001BEF5633|nr:MdtL family multidrug efflux MFS transporter [Shewanella algae]BCV40275.1 multidrug resistance protein MdtL [Shewanella algae]